MKALLVGINKYMQPGNDLAGCVNDVMDMRQLLASYDAKKSDIKMLTDKQATQAKIVAGLEWLMSFKTNNSRTVIIIDACHSGTGTRGINNLYLSGHTVCGAVDRGRYRCSKYLESPFEWKKKQYPRNKFGLHQTKDHKETSSRMNHILLAACKSTQTAADASFGGRPNGAWSYYLLEALGIRKPIETAFAGAKKNLKEDGYEQTPQLEGPVNLKKLPVMTNSLLLFMFSGHGSQVPDMDGDEVDKLDEIICSYDCNSYWNSPLSDDVLARILKTGKA